MLGEMLNNVRQRRRLIHYIGNYVTANDCANLLLACGASPVMADDPTESVQITSHAQGLVLNLGTPNPRKTEAMFLSAKCANEKRIPVILDPVGAAASTMRLNTARRLLDETHISVIRGNADEINALLVGGTQGSGVDAAQHERQSEKYEAAAYRLAQKTGCVVCMSAAVDVVTDGKRIYRVYNGHEMMRCVTGAGCQLSALTGAYAAANPKQLLEAALAAVCAMGLCGEKAYARMDAQDGNAAMRKYMIDAMFRMTAEELKGGARYEQKV